MLTAPAVSNAEAAALFADLAFVPALVLAVSGGPDSTALLILMARWRAQRPSGPRIMAVTVDHQLRPEAAAEAAAVAALAGTLRIEHRTVRWDGPKPRSGIQAAARAARYRLLAQEAARARASHILTAHTLDDQAETVLFRLARGSGIGGLAAMARSAPLPAESHPAEPAAAMMLVRPFLTVPKAQLVATCAAAGVACADDPSNRDPRFARPRLRRVLPLLTDEGLTGLRLARLAARAARADAALDWAVDEALRLLPPGTNAAPAFVMPLGAFLAWPDEIALRVLARAIARLGTEGPVELGKLEALALALRSAAAGPERATAIRWRRTLAGALISLSGGRLAVAPAPARRLLHQEMQNCPTVPLAACHLGHTLPAGTTPGRHPQGLAEAGEGRGIASPLKGSG